MSDGITASNANRAQESEYREHLVKMKKLKSEFDQKYNSAIKTNNNLLLRLQKDYDVELSTLKNQTEKRLADLRSKHENRISDEEKRLNIELNDIKKSNEDRKNELKESQQEEINRLLESHNNNLENARKKYLSRMAKLDANE